MHADDRSIETVSEIALDPVGTLFPGFAESGQGVLRCIDRCTPVRDDLRVVHGHGMNSTSGHEQADQGDRAAAHTGTGDTDWRRIHTPQGIVVS